MLKMLIGDKFGKNETNSKMRVSRGSGLLSSKTTLALLLLVYSCGYDFSWNGENVHSQSNWLIQSVHCFDEIDDILYEPFLNYSQLTNLTGPSRPQFVAQLNRNGAKLLNITFDPSVTNCSQYVAQSNDKPMQNIRRPKLDEVHSHFSHVPNIKKPSNMSALEKAKSETPEPYCICNCTNINLVQLNNNNRNRSANQNGTLGYISGTNISFNKTLTSEPDYCYCKQKCARPGPLTDSTQIINQILSEIFNSYNQNVNCTLDSSPLHCNCSLSNIFCVGTRLGEVPPERNDFSHYESIRLDLSDNLLYAILNNSFASRFHLMEALTITKSEIDRIEINTFRNWTHLTYLNLIGNSLVKIENNTFQHLRNLKLLYLAHNSIVSLIKGSFNGLESLLELDLSYCKLTKIEFGTFTGMRKLEVLLLTSNQIDSIDPDAFNDMHNLRTLSLSHNRLRLIKSGLFWDIRNLKTLSISHNLLAGIRPQNVEELIELRHLDLSHNQIDYLEENNFGNMTELVWLDLRHNQFQNMPNSFLGYNLKLKDVYFDDFRMCVYALNVSACHPSTDGISSVHNLIGNHFLRVCVLIIASIAALGNIAIIFGPIHEEGRFVHSLLMRNLAVSNLAMGMYLWMIMYYDWVYNGEYIRHDEQWRQSSECRYAGVISALSYESSVLILAYITADRYYNVTCPPVMKQRKLLFAIMTGIWTVSVLLAMLPVIYSESFGDDFYGSNGICTNLKINETYSAGWEYTALLYCGLHIGAVLFVVYVYVQLLRQPVPKVYPNRFNERQQQRKLDEYLKQKEKNKYFEWRCACLALSNGMVWLILAFVKYLSLVQIPIEPQLLFGWLLLFVFALNAALSPTIFVLTNEKLNKTYDSFVLHLIGLCRISRKLVTGQLGRLPEWIPLGIMNKGADREPETDASTNEPNEANGDIEPIEANKAEESV